MAIVLRNGKRSRTYQVKVTDRMGRLFPTKTFSTKRDAEIYERSLKLAVDNNEIPQQKQVRELTVSSYWDFWSEEFRSKVSKGWKMTQEQMWRDYIKPYLGSYKLVDVRPQQIRSLMNALETKDLSAQTRCHVYNLLHKMFQDATEDDPAFIGVNPVVRKYKPVVITKERKHHSPEESRKLLEHCRDDHYGPAVWLSWCLGLRSEAIMALRVKCVNFESGQILISECYKRKTKAILPYPKGKKADYVPMPANVATYLQEKLTGKDPDDFVVSGPRNEMVSYNALLRNYKRLCREAGVTELTTHEGRHSTSELWIESGASEQDIGRLLLQKNSATTKRYIHRSDGRLKIIAEKVGQSFQKISPTVDDAQEVGVLESVEG